MADTKKIDVLLATIDRHWSQAKQSEDQRASMTNYLLTIYGAAQAYIIQRAFDKSCIMIAIVIIILAAYGMTATYKYYERFRSHAAVVGVLMDTIDAENIGINLHDIEEAAKIKHKAKFSWFSKIRLFKIWLLLHGLFVFLAIVNIAMIILKNAYCINIL